MVKNVKQSITLQASALLPPDLTTAEIVAECNRILATEAKDDTEALKEMLVGTHLKEKLDSFGVEFPYSTVEVSLSLGNFIRSLVSNTFVRPSAPLKLAAYNKTMKELFERFESDEFEVKAEELSLIRKVMDSDEMWGKTYFPVAVGNAIVPITAGGMSLFSKVVDAAIEMFEEAQKEKAAEKALLKEKKKSKKGKK